MMQALAGGRTASRPQVVRPCSAHSRPAALARPVSRRNAVRAVAAAAAAAAAPFMPPTVSDTKARFLENYKKPIAAIYSTVLNELIVQHHFIRYNQSYEYNPIFALGFVSVFDQIMESVPAEERAKVFSAYIAALEEKGEDYRADAAALESAAGGLSGPEALTADANGSDLQKALARVAEKTAAGDFGYNKFFAIGLFRLLELTGAKEPSALERLVKSVGVKPENVNRDLVLYKGILSKLSAAKELMKEFIIREKRKQAEREAAKAAKAEGKAPEPVPAGASASSSSSSSTSA